MKLEELMLNDWVLYNENPCKVARISERLFLEKDGKVFFAPIEKISPLPLTMEILEKNGFEVHRQYATLTEYWLDIPQKWVRVAPDSYIEIYNGVNKNVHIDGKYYVHELQHALRLCEIDKDIIL